MRHKNLHVLPADTYLNLVLAAQHQLEQNPFDLVHGIDHHSRVNNFAIELVISEKIPVEWRTVSIAAWWHDIEDKDGQRHGFLSQALKEARVDDDLQDVIIEAIEHHSFFNSTHTSLESQVLFDADKSDYINPTRLLYFSELAQAGSIDDKVVTKYVTLWFDRMETLESRLYFEPTKHYYQKYHQLAYQIMNKLK